MAETLGTLQDKLQVTNLKLWHAEEVAHDPDASDKEIADAKRRINILNNQRNDLIQEWDELFARSLQTGVAPKVFPQLKNYSKNK